MNNLFIIKVKVLMLTKWSYRYPQYIYIYIKNNIHICILRIFSILSSYVYNKTIASRLM